MAALAFKLAAESVYDSGPLATLSQVQTDSKGWSLLSSDLMAVYLYQTMGGVPDIKCIHDFCFNDLLTGAIAVESALQKQSRHPADDAAEDVKRSQRSLMWGKFASMVALYIAAFGFCIVSKRPNTEYLAILDEDEWQPCVLDVARHEFHHRIDASGVHEWKVYELQYGSTRKKRIRNFRVLGDPTEFPNAVGLFTSKTIRTMRGIYRLARNKVEVSITADEKRGKPALLLAQPETKGQHSDKDLDSGLGDPSWPSLTREQVDECKHAVDECDRKNATGPDGSTDPRQPPRRKFDSSTEGTGAIASATGASTVNLPRHKVVQPYAFPEAPLDVLPSHEAVFQDACKQWHVPPQLISASDATGKSHLNTNAAGNASFKIFEVAQARRRQEIVMWIKTIHEFMYGDRLTARQLAEEQAMKEKKNSSSKRKRSEKDEETFDDIEDDDDDDGDEDSIEDAVRRMEPARHQVTVTLPVNHDISTLLSLREQGIITFEGLTKIISRQMGIDPSCFPREQEPPPAAAATAKLSDASDAKRAKLAEAAAESAAEREAKAAAAEAKRNTPAKKLKSKL